jgi:hypothetical protein
MPSAIACVGIEPLISLQAVSLADLSVPVCSFYCLGNQCALPLIPVVESHGSFMGGGGGPAVCRHMARTRAKCKFVDY